MSAKSWFHKTICLWDKVTEKKLTAESVLLDNLRQLLDSLRQSNMFSWQLKLNDAKALLF